MKCACLIPVTRNDLVQTAIQHAEADGWTVFQEEDTERIGCNTIRNRLLKTALAAGAEFIRFADDDDFLLPHREAAMDALRDSDIAYFDFSLERDGQKAPFPFTGDIHHDAMRLPSPWVWVARADALRRFTDDDPLFDPSVICVHGGEAFFRLLREGLRIKHVPVLAYNWRYGIRSPHELEDPRRHEAARLLLKRVDEWFRDGGKNA